MSYLNLGMWTLSIIDAVPFKGISNKTKTSKIKYFYLYKGGTIVKELEVNPHIKRNALQYDKYKVTLQILMYFCMKGY